MRLVIVIVLLLPSGSFLGNSDPGSPPRSSYTCDASLVGFTQTFKSLLTGASAFPPNPVMSPLNYLDLVTLRYYCTIFLYNLLCKSPLVRPRYQYNRSQLYTLRHQSSPPLPTVLRSLANNRILRYRGSRGGRNKVRAIPPIITRRPSHPTFVQRAPGNNLRPVQLSSFNLSTIPTPGISLQPTPFPPSLYVLNVRSLAKPHAIENLRADVLSLDPDLVVLTETHLKSHHPSSEFGINVYNMVRRDRIGWWGGWSGGLLQESFL